MTRFSPTSGTTSASVPMAATLMKPGSQLSRPARRHKRLHQLQRDADAGQVLVGIGAVVPLRIDHRQRRRQLRVRLVMIGDDQIDAELARAPRRLGAADAAIHRHDQRDAVGVQPLDRRRLQAVAVLQPLRDEVDDVGAEQLERAAQDHGRRDAVDVVVAVDRDPLPAARSPRGCDRRRPPMSASAIGSCR